MIKQLFFHTTLPFSLIISLIVLVLSSCENDIATVNLISSKSNLPAESGKNVEIIYSDSARTKMILRGKQIDRYEGQEPYYEFPKGIEVEFYDNYGALQSKITANYAIRREKSQLMEAKQDVVVLNEKGEMLNTEHLIWDESKDLIYTEEFVKITTKDEILYGDGLESNQSFTKYKIKNIKGTINLHETN